MSAVIPARRTKTLVILSIASAAAVVTAAEAVRSADTARVRSALERRLGRAADAIAAPYFVSQSLAGDLPAALGAAPIIAVDGVATAEATGAQAPRITVYGVDDRFWTLHGVTAGPALTPGEAILGPALTAALGVQTGDRVTLTVPRGADTAPSTLHERRQDLVRALRVRVAAPSRETPATLSPLDLWYDGFAAFVALATLQEDPAWQGRVNAILLARANENDAPGGTARAPSAASLVAGPVAGRLSLDDHGLDLQLDEQARELVVVSRTGSLDEATVDAVSKAALDIGALPTPTLTTLAYAMRVGDREIGFPFVTSIELQAVAPEVHAEELALPPVVLNAVAAQRLGASAARTLEGQVLSISFPVRQRDGGVASEEARFQIAGVVAVEGAAASRLLTPPVPGVTGVPTLGQWTPRIPFDASRVKQADEDYWSRHGATPQAFVPPPVGRALWRTSLGAATSVRVTPAAGMAPTEARAQFEPRLRQRLLPGRLGLHGRDLLQEARDRAETESLGFGWLRWWPWHERRSSTTRVPADAESIPDSTARVPAHTGSSPDSATARRTDRGGYALVVHSTLPRMEPLGPAFVPPGTALRIHDTGSPSSFVTAGALGLRVGAVDNAFIDQGRFTFAAALDRSDEERGNPWLILRREARDPSDPAAGAASPVVPVVTTARTLRALGRKLGDDLPIAPFGRPVRLRFVAALRGDLFDRTVLMHDSAFAEWFPAASGYHWFGVDAPDGQVADVRARLARELQPLGLHEAWLH